MDLQGQRWYKHPKPQFTCVNTAGNAYTVEAEAAPPLHSSFLGTLWPFRSTSWRRFKHSQGVHGTIRATLPHTLPAEMTSEQNLPNLVLWTFLNRHFTGAVPGLLFALSSGNKRQLDPALKIRLNHAGLAHLMAVSGYHVGLVSFPLLLLMRHRRSAFRFIGFVGLVGTWSFIGFCGFPTSAVRAGLMITGYSLSQLARLNLSAMQLLSLAAWSMLIYCPGWSRDLGMQLSFVAVYAILLGIELLKVSNIRHPIALYLAVPVAAQLGTGVHRLAHIRGVPEVFSLLQHRGLAPDGVVGNCTRWHRGSRPRLGLASGCAHRKLGCRWRIESIVDLVGVIAFTCMDLEPARRGWRIAHGVEFGMACWGNPRGSAAALLTAVFMGLLCRWIGLDSLDRMAGAPTHRGGVPLWTRYRRCIVNGRIHGDACTG